jgi:hypothetical protein
MSTRIILKKYKTGSGGLTGAHERVGRCGIGGLGEAVKGKGKGKGDACGRATNCLSAYGDSTIDVTRACNHQTSHCPLASILLLGHGL